MNNTTTILSSNNNSTIMEDMEDIYLYITSVCILYGLVFIFGLIGNIMVMFAILRYPRMQSVTNVFLLSLSTADLLVIIICVPVKLAKWVSYTWTFGAFLCKFIHYLQDASLYCSVLTLVVMSIERYYAIKHPIRAKFVCTKDKARFAVCIVWMVSFVVAAPILYGRNLEKVGNPKDGYHYWCVKQWKRDSIERAHEIGTFLGVLVIPITIMATAYLSICRELWILTYKRKHGDNSFTEGSSSSERPDSVRQTYTITRVRTSGNEEHSRKQVIKMLMAIILIFIICWAPTLTDNVLVAFDVLEKFNYGYLKQMRQAFVLMSYLNSAINPIVYAFMSRNFRETFKFALCLCINKDWVRRKRYRRHQSFTTQTVHSTFSKSVNNDTVHSNLSKIINTENNTDVTTTLS